MNPEIKVEGKSGCPISIAQTPHGYIIIKQAKDADYAPRLVKQAEKQNAFFIKSTLESRFITPEILAINTDNNNCIIKMRFVNAESYSAYLTKQRKENLDNLISEFVTYFSSNFEQSTTLYPNENHVIFYDKAIELEGKLTKIKHLDTTFTKRLAAYLLNNIPNHPIALGPCHGDFTLSNMLFANNNKIYLIDFLDSFIESPIIDYIKLRQDSKYHWSPFIEEEHINNVRLLQTLSYIDVQITTKIETKFPMIKNWESYLTTMNFARILPYVNSVPEFAYLTKNINTLLPKI